MTQKNSKPYCFHPDTEYFLRKSGWYPGRDLTDRLCFPPEKNIFPAALTIFKEFGYLDIYYNYKYKRPGMKNIFRHHGSLEMSLIADEDSLMFMNHRSSLYPLTDEEIKTYVAEHNLKDITEIEKQKQKLCCYLGKRFDSTSIYEDFIFIDEAGMIYTTYVDDDFPQIANSFNEFLDEVISRERFSEKVERD